VGAQVGWNDGGGEGSAIREPKLLREGSSAVVWGGTSWPFKWQVQVMMLWLDVVGARCACKRW